MVENVHLQTRIDYINCIRPCLHELQALVILHSNFQMSVIFLRHQTQPLHLA